MNYVVVSFLLILPFFLNIHTYPCTTIKKPFHPLFFFISCLSFFQIFLSWIPLLEIQNYVLYETITYMVIISTFIMILTRFVKNIKKTKVDFKKYCQNNVYSFISLVILIIELIIILSIPEITIFSDTNAYVQISQNFKDSIYSFNFPDNLSIEYRIPMGYYLNSVITNDDSLASITYKIIWPLTTIFMFYWLVEFFVTSKLKNWKFTYKVIIIIFTNVIYLCIVNADLYLLASGNIETQILFVMTTLVLLLTKNTYYVIFSVFAFLYFSSTALIISPIPLLLTLIMLITKSRKYELFSYLSGVISLLLLVISIIVRSGNLEIITKITILSSGTVGITMFMWIHLRNNVSCLYGYLSSFSYLGCQTLYTSNRNKVMMSYKKYQNIILTISYGLSVGVVLILAKFWIFSIWPDWFYMSYENIMISVFITIYSTYSCFTNKKPLEITKWLTYYNWAFIVITIPLIIMGIFNINASAWRIIFSTVTTSRVNNKIILWMIIITSIIQNKWKYFIQNANVVSKIFFHTPMVLICLMTVNNWLPIWKWRIETINNLTKDTTGYNKWDFKFNPIDSNIFADINSKSGKNQIYSYYTDMHLMLHLNKLYAFGYNKPWESNIFNDFIMSDAWMHIMQSVPQNKLIYYDTQNTINNINFIIQKSIENISTNISLGSIDITVNDATQNIPVKYDQITVKGSPDFIILNRHSSYYNYLEIVKTCNNNENKSFTVNNKGYKLLLQTSDVDYYLNIDRIFE